MSTYWDFRSILDVDPDESGFTCVGITQKGARCKQWMFSSSDRSCASTILDEMDAHKRLSSSRKYLEELAELTLCPRWHRKPGYSQVQSVTKRWKREIADYAAEMEREEQKAARVQSRRAPAESEKQLVRNKIERAEDAVKDKFPIANYLPTTVKTERTVSTTVVELKAKASYATVKPMLKVSVADITPPSSIENKPSRMLYGSKEQTDSRKSSDLPSHKISLPSPPALLLNSNPPSTKEAKAEQYPAATPTKSSSRQRIEMTKTLCIKVTAATESNAVVLMTISEEKTKLEIFNLKFPTTPDAPPQPHNKQISTGFPAYEFGAGKQVPLPAFDLGTVAKLPASIPVVDSEFPSTSFSFSTPIKLPSSKEDPFVSTSDSLPEKSSTPIKTAPIHTNTGLVSAAATQEPTKNEIYEPAESYGYAIVTPSTTPYKSHLPSQHRYGLATPPETPQSRRDGFQDPFAAFISDSPASLEVMLRKPLPNTPDSGLRDGDAETCEACGSGEDQCACVEGTDGDNEKVGCFQSLRLRKLRKIVVRKINAVKTRTRGAIHRHSGLSMSG